VFFIVDTTFSWGVFVMKLAKNFSVLIVITLATFLIAGTVARADVVYIYDSGTPTERFNNSKGTETEDNWVANAFAVVEGGTRLLSIDYPIGENFVAQPVTAVIYQGADISDPSAGGGLVRVQTTEALVTGDRGTIQTIVLDAAVDLNVGDVFYAALLIRNVTGNLFPFYNDGVLPQGHSFFDVGPAQSAAYDLDVTTNATVLGATHPVVGAGVQSPGNLFLRVNATDTPP